MYVHELIDCMFFVIDNANERINAFNVGPKDGAKVSEIAEIFLNQFGTGQKIKYTGGKTGWKGDVPFYSHNSEKLNNLGWEPKLSSKEAVDRPVQSPSSQSALFGLYDLAPSNSSSKKFLKSFFIFCT